MMNELYKVSSNALQSDAESDTPIHRHLVVFSFKALRCYLNMIGFSKVEGYGFRLISFSQFYATRPGENRSISLSSNGLYC